MVSEWTPNGLQVDPEWSPSGLQLGPKWTPMGTCGNAKNVCKVGLDGNWAPSGIKNNSKWTPNGFKRGSKWIPNRLQVDSKRLRVDSESSPSGLRIVSKWTNLREAPESHFPLHQTCKIQAFLTKLNLAPHVGNRLINPQGNFAGNESYHTSK